jgi:hypothetical protein
MTGDIVEGLEGPMLVTDEAGSLKEGIIWSTQATLPGPPTRDQQERRDYNECWEQRKREQEAAYAKLRDDITTLVLGYKHEFTLARDVTDRICNLYRTYCDEWETY